MRRTSRTGARSPLIWWAVMVRALIVLVIAFLVWKRPIADAAPAVTALAERWSGS